MSRILVPLDGSEFSEQALPYALDMGRRTGAELHIVRVHAPPQVDWLAGGFLPVPMNADAVTGILKEELAYLDQVAEDAAARGARPARTALLNGPVAPAIDGYVRANGIDLVIMTTHGRTGLSRAWMGSVADALVRMVDVPVLLLRVRESGAPAPAPIEHILVPVDESDRSLEILGPATELGRFSGARYTLLQVIAPPLDVPAADAVALPLPFARAVELRVEAADRLEERARQLRAQDYDVDTLVVINAHVADGIIEQAAALKADLIAMATHGRHGLARVALGSVVDKVVRGTSVPVLLWKPPTSRFNESDRFDSGRHDENRHLGFAHDRATDAAHAAADPMRPPV